MMPMKFSFELSAIALALPFLAACSSAVKMPDATQVQSDAQIRAASAWQAPLPHGGSAVKLVDWWTQLGDPVFDELMQDTQQGNATLAQSRATLAVALARANEVRIESALLPQIALQAQSSRSVQAPKAPPASGSAVVAQMSWEIDLWGGNRAALSVAQLRTRGAEINWHEARVIVAAEMASLYTGYRYCENLLSLLQRDAASRSETARLAELSANAGFTAPASAHLARASSFDAANSVTLTQAQCDAQIKALVAMSGLEETLLLQKLQFNKAASQKINTRNELFSISSAITQLPAQLLAQRPDIATAQQDVMIAALNIKSTDAARYPSLSLNGSIGSSSSRQVGIENSGSVWSVGPIAITIPLTNLAAINSNTEAAVAAYNEAVNTLQAKARQAVREVEENLVSLNSANLRGTQSKEAAVGYAASLAATQSRYRAGLASLVELEDARRTALFAEQNQLAVERERISAWINLYRATGGGWTPASIIASQSNNTAQPLPQPLPLK
jgi:outer membrane protein, multidrug efflux system